MALRDYQENCIQATLSALQLDGIKRQAVSLPVGSGKTFIFSHLIARLPPPTPSATKCLVLAHREELLDQAARMINRVNPLLKVMIEQGKDHADPSAADVIVASVPTLGRRDSRRLFKYDPSLFKCVIVDEAHHAAADTYLRIFNHFNLLNTNSDTLLWGCSATLSRNDHLALAKVFDKIVFHMDLMQAMNSGHLCPLRTIQVDTEISMDVASAAGDYDLDQLSLAIDTPKRNQLVVDTWHRIAHLEHKRKSTIVFGLNVKHVEAMAHLFTTLPGDIRPAVITGNTVDSVRRDILDLYQQGSIQVLLNCAVLTEGTDLPLTDCLLLTRPTCNANLYVQMVGRGLRRHAGKEYCLLLDVVDKWKSKERGRSLITFPSLYSARPEPLEHDGEAEPLSIRQHTDALVSRMRVRLSEQVQSVIDMGGHRIAWIPIGALENDFLFIGHDGRGILALLRVSPDYLASIDLTLDKHRTVQIAPTGTPLHSALESLSLHLQNSKLLLRFSKDAPWRRHPITTNQLAYVAKIARLVGAPDTIYKELCRWTVGRASDFLTRYFYMKNHGLGFDGFDLDSVCLIRKH